MSISVLIASYNGGKYIKEQLDSIIKQLSIDDEIIISDDGSTDNTLKLIESYMEFDSRIRLYKNRNLGVIKNFEFLITKAKKDIIFFSDQDDVWRNDKVRIVMEFFEKYDKKVILHNGVHFYGKVEDRNYKKIIRNKKKGFFNNLLKSSYWGCCMALKKEFICDIIPFPNNITAHDQWVGLLSEYKKEICFIDIDLIYHRIHDSNKSKKLSIKGKVMFRLNMFLGFLEYLFLHRDRRFQYEKKSK